MDRELCMELIKTLKALKTELTAIRNAIDKMVSVEPEKNKE